MSKRSTKVGTHVSWRISAPLKKRFQRFLETSPPCDRTQYLETALTYYLDAIAKYGMHPSTLFPKK